MKQIKIVSPTKKSYQTPKVMVKIVYLENCLTAASATISPGGSNTSQPWNPEIDDWTESGGQSRDFNL